MDAANATPVRLVDVVLRLKPSVDDRHVAIEIIRDGRAIRLAYQVFGRLLLALARARLADKASALPESEHGWVHVSNLSETLDVTEAHVSVLVHRARRQLFTKAGVIDSNDVVERRRATRELRIGTDQFIV